jgi:predicted neuraminidase
MAKLQRFGLLCCTLCVVAIGADLAQRWAGAAPPLQAAMALVAAGDANAQSTRLPVITLQAQGKIPMPADTPAAHASSLLVMPTSSPAQMLAVWFAGERESAPNVQIAFSWFDRVSKAWVPARFVVNRFALGKQLGFGVRRLGNPVAWLDSSGRVHLFVVATGLGGWAAGRIVHLRQDTDVVATTAQALDQLQFSAVRTLPLSWLWNTSHLVRTAPMPLADGGMVLPVYFELGLKYPVALRFDAQGQWLGMVRMSIRGDSLQPTIVPLSATQWLAFLRDYSAVGKVAVVATDNAGQSWRDMPSLDIVNTGSSMAAMRLPSGQFVMAHNKSPSTRRDMDVSVSADGLHWQTAVSVENGVKMSDEYSYPAMAWDGQSLWLSYTDMRREIAWRKHSVQTAGRAP